MPSYHSQDVGAVLRFLALISLSEGAAWDGVADVNGASIDRHAYDLPLSGKLRFEIDGTAADTARVALESSADDTTFAAVTDKDGNAIVVDLVAGTTDAATIDFDLAGADQYIRGTLVAANSVIATTAQLACTVVLAGGKVNG